MAYATQCCVRCSTLEDGHTGPGDRYLCGKCYRAGWRVMAGGALYQVLSYNVHVWRPGQKPDTAGIGLAATGAWVESSPPIEAATPREAYLAGQARHPGETVHVARVLAEPCSPGERAHV